MSINGKLGPYLKHGIALLMLVIGGDAACRAVQPDSKVNDKATESERAYSSGHAGTSSNPGWHLLTQGKTYGRFEWWLSERGGRVDSSIVSFMKLAKAKEFIIFSTTNKTFKVMKTDRKSLDETAKVHFGTHGKTKFGPWKLEKTDKILGYNCDVYSRLSMNPEHDAQYGSWLEQKIWMGHLPLSKTMIETVQLFNSIDGIDVTGVGIPLMSRMHYKEFLVNSKRVTTDRDEIVFQMTKIDKTSVPDSLFVLGKDYKAVKDEATVIFSRGLD